MADEGDQAAADPHDLQKLLTNKRFDLRNLWRALFWGGFAAASVALVGGAALSDAGKERIKVALARAIEQPTAAPTESPRAAELEKQTAELTDTVRQLTLDRDRLKGRIAILEQSLDDITGAIKKQATQPASPPLATLSPATPSSPPPIISPPATIAATASPRLTTPATGDAGPSSVATVGPPIDPVPLPPVRAAALDPVVAPDADPAPVAKSEIGVDLGSSATLEGLRAQWAAIKANHGPLLGTLRPSYTARQKAAGGNEYRLIAGPFPNAADAMRLCSKLTPARVYCRAGIFTVQNLAAR